MRVAATCWRVLLLAAGLCVSASAVSAPCAGFNDVDTGSAFCANVEWVKNRSITLGCTATQYCPNDPVTRLQMAAFMNRFGLAVQPSFVHKHEVISAFDPSSPMILCQVDYTAVDFARLASPASVFIYHSAAAASTLFAKLVVSFDAGSTWSDWGQSTVTSNIGGLFVSQSPAAPPIAVPAGSTARFGIRAARPAIGPLVEEAGCELSVRLENITASSIM